MSGPPPPVYLYSRISFFQWEKGNSAVKNRQLYPLPRLSLQCKDREFPRNFDVVPKFDFTFVTSSGIGFMCDVIKALSRLLVHMADVTKALLQRDSSIHISKPPWYLPPFLPPTHIQSCPALCPCPQATDPCPGCSQYAN